MSRVDRLAIAWEREAATRSFAAFTRRAWPVVEPNPLQWNWHIGAICEHLQAVRDGQIRRLVVAVPPGMTKSLLVSTLYPAWDWINNPQRRFIFASYAQGLSDKSAWLHRQLVTSEWYANRFDTRLSEQSATRVRDFATTMRGWRFSTSVGGEVTGRHADVLVFDDLVKAQASTGLAAVDAAAIEKANEFWFKTMATRRSDASTTSYIGIAQRLHHEDTIGKCIDRGYCALVLPMEFDAQRRCITYLDTGEPFFEDPRTSDGELLDPNRFPAEEVVALKASLLNQAEAQLQQNPTPRSGSIFKGEWFQHWATIPEGAYHAIFVDCAFKDTKTSDYVAVQCWAKADNAYYLVDQIHARFNIQGTVGAIIEMRDRHPQAVATYVEDKANGPAVVQILSGEIPVKEWTPSGSKVARAESAAALFETRKVYLPPEGTGWLGKYKSELLKFPLTKHDDQVDATSMALLTLYRPERRRYADAVGKLRRG